MKFIVALLLTNSLGAKRSYQRDVSGLYGDGTDGSTNYYDGEPKVQADVQSYQFELDPITQMDTEEEASPKFLQKDPQP